MTNVNSISIKLYYYILCISFSHLAVIYLFIIITPLHTSLNLDPSVRLFNLKNIYLYLFHILPLSLSLTLSRQSHHLISILFLSLCCFSHEQQQQKLHLLTLIQVSFLSNNIINLLQIVMNNVFFLSIFECVILF